MGALFAIGFLGSTSLCLVVAIAGEIEWAVRGRLPEPEPPESARLSLTMPDARATLGFVRYPAGRLALSPELRDADDDIA
jgi:hypothetical protein